MRSEGADGSRESNERQIKLTVLPSFWESERAIGLYIGFGTFLIIGLALFIRFVQHQKMAVQVERLEKGKIREINQHKLNFFTYISHEFKTPLTLIIAAVDELLQKRKQIIPFGELKVIKRNANRLHVLIDQLMEFRKIESDHGKIHYQKGDIILFLRDTFRAFQNIMDAKHINAAFTSNDPVFMAYFDADKVEKIVSNVLSNAAKNTKAHGQVTLNVQIEKAAEEGEQPCLRLMISNTGIGMTEEEKKQILEPFYSGDDQDTSYHPTGIGMTLVNSLINFLGGQLEIESRAEEGTDVIIDIPLQTALVHPQGAYKEIQGNAGFVADDSLFVDPEETDVASGQPEKVLRLLIVEDNKELLHFLGNHFKREFDVETATNGEKALVLIENHPPDLILSDVMMPKMDGLELCRRIKEHKKYRHIPFVFLSAKSELAHRLEGLDVGVEAYLPKPFHLEEIDMMVRNIVNARRAIHEHFLQIAQLNNESIPVSNKDQQYIKELTLVVERFIDDPDFNTTQLAREMNCSRSLLHLKLKKILDLSASNFIQQIRMKRATQFLDNGMRVSEVAFKVGYKDPSYFSKVFKKEFEVLPSQYLDGRQEEVDIR